MPLMPRSRRQKGRGQNESPTREQGSCCKNEALSVSSEPIGPALESCDCFRDIENLNCVAYAKAAGTPTDARAKQ